MSAGPGPVECAACHQPVDATAVRCPHCGAMQPNAKVGLAGKAVSTDEIVSMLNVHDATVNKPDRTLWQTLIEPHPDTHGLGRVVERTCTVIAFPLVLAGYVGLALAFRSRRAGDGNFSELGAVATMALFGTIGMQLVLSVAVSLPSSLTLSGVTLLALIVRAAVRIRMALARRRKLHRLAQPDAVPPPTGLDAPAAKPAAASIIPLQTSAPAPVALASLDDGPSLLK